MADITINKVKIMGDQEKINILFTKKTAEHTMIYQVTGDELAAPEFYQAFEKLTRSCLNIFEFPEDFMPRLNPYGVSFKYDSNDVMSAVISCKLDLPESGTSIALNTPNKKCPEDAVDAQDKAKFFSDTTVKALWEVEKEARKYLDGKRAQMDLFGDTDGEAAVNDDGPAHSQTHASTPERIAAANAPA